MPKKNPGLSSTTSEPTNEEKVIAINELRQSFPLNELLKFYRIAKSSYYYGLKALKAIKNYVIKYLKYTKNHIVDTVLNVLHWL